MGKNNGKNETPSKPFDIKNISSLLLQEAIESLEYGLKYYDDYCVSENISTIKQSIINFQRFIEYTLKYFAAEINPLLVFTDALEKNIILEKARSITFDQALTFYINNLEHGLIDIPSGYKKGEFKFKLSCLKILRNKITHFFIYPHEISDVHQKLSEVIELLYFIYSEKNISDAIHEKLSPEAQETLNSLTDTQKIKLQKAYNKVEEYKHSRISHDPKEANDMQAPLFSCPDCSKKNIYSS